jgi:hypothetical protein
VVARSETAVHPPTLAASHALRQHCDNFPPLSHVNPLMIFVKRVRLVEMVQVGNAHAHVRRVV